MTLPAGTNSEDESGATPGTGLAPVEGHTGIETFLAAAATAEPEAPRPRSWRMRLFDYSAHAAMIVGLIGFAWTVSDHVVHRPAALPTGAITTGDAAPAPRKVAVASPIKPEYAKPDPAAAKPDELSELRRANTRMAEDIRTLRADLATLNKTVSRDQAREQLRSLSASIDGVNSGLAATKTETSAALAQLSGKIEKMQREARAQTDTGATGSLPPKPAATEKSAPLPPIKPVAAKFDAGKPSTGKSAATKLASLEEDRKPPQDPPAQKPAAVAGWTVLDVYEGVALVEGKRGTMEVMPGVAIPGAGLVRSIDRTGNGWTVTTSKGVIAFGPPGHFARHASTREPYRPYRYDF